MTEVFDALAGGISDHRFQTTRWTQIVDTRALDPQVRQQALEALIRRYWRPVFSFLRQKGLSQDQAQDITQSFFHEAVLERNFIQKADPARGRFRTYLLTALDHYVAGYFRKNAAQKRTPLGGFANLDIESMSECAALDIAASPEQMFNYIWAIDLIDTVLDEMQKAYARTGRAVYWQIFYERIIKPILEETPVPALSELGEKYNIHNAKKVSNMIITAKRRFRRDLLDAAGRRR